MSWFYTIGRTFICSSSALPEVFRRAGWVSSTIAVEVILRSERLAPPGFVANFAELAALGDYLDSGLDPESLSGLVVERPTYEHLARHLFAWCVENLPPPLPEHLAEVRVAATPAAWASYRRDPW